MKSTNWKKIAKSLARSIVRFDKNPFGRHVSDQALVLAYKVSKKKFQ